MNVAAAPTEREQRSLRLWVPGVIVGVTVAALVMVGIDAGGPHHTAFSQAATSEHIEDFAEMVAIDCLFLDGQTQLGDIKRQLRS